ncbi:glycerophosphoryl diester phosphodiesterase [Bacillus oleivorans]|uniref:Glycerophosphoryl diester phosphodiesterase n=1 Tax=Bacillus oleivorans TaxID=1448271 RepID=A0A285CQZ7_9BACI|nr:glycerophosphodiester phosphodiesterase [Bacillus oleivorans]SNX69977.1 glycerophosphoryl diester phosphodiesterase [Bacillus oleivorans]
MGNVVYERKKSTSGRILKLSLFVLIGFIVILLALPGQKADPHPFLKTDKPLVIAHQGGAHLAPSNTMAAFEQADRLGADVLEFDVHITKDGHLVAIHDATVDRTTNGTGKVDSFTLEELKELDAGFTFQDENGNYVYRGKGVTIPTVQEIFEAFPDQYMMIEIKDDNPPERMDETVQKLWQLIHTYGMEDQILVVSFDQNIVDSFKVLSGHQVALGGGREEVKSFVISSMLSIQPLYRPKVHGFQLPLREGELDLTKKYVLENAHRRGMKIYYWTINDRETMEMLIERGADGIITDRPDLLLEVLSEK